MKNIYFEKVEEILDLFPIECRKNYYENKKTLVIKEGELFGSIKGAYDHYKNEITLADINALPHELFHVAFRDKSKLNKRISKKDEVYFANGVEYSLKFDKYEYLYGRGLNEGLTEYLSRKCSSLKGNHYYYFFVDLLISIYGEDILEYAFYNNPKLFFDDERFYNVEKIYDGFDALEESLNAQNLLVDCIDGIKETLEKGEKSELVNINKVICMTQEIYRKAIIDMFMTMIDEYKNCYKPLISKEEFVNKLYNFLEDSDYKLAFIFDDDEYDLREKISLLIEELNCKKLEKSPIKK